MRIRSLLIALLLVSAAALAAEWSAPPPPCGPGVTVDALGRLWPGALVYASTDTNTPIGTIVDGEDWHLFADGEIRSATLLRDAAGAESWVKTDRILPDSFLIRLPCDHPNLTDRR